VEWSEVESEMSKGERMKTHTGKTGGDDLSVGNSSAKEEKENSTQCVLNLEEALTVEIYTNERIAEFDQAEAELAALLKGEIPATIETEETK
jgi:hypothetical protein